MKKLSHQKIGEYKRLFWLSSTIIAQILVIKFINSPKMWEFLLINTAYLVLVNIIQQYIDKVYVKNLHPDLSELQNKLKLTAIGLDSIHEDYQDMKSIALEEARYEYYWNTFKNAVDITENNELLKELINKIETQCNEDADKFLKEKGIG